MERDLVLGLDGAHDVQTVGGKARALAKMLAAGFSVPEGFVVSAHAFKHMTAQLQEQLLKRFDDLGADFVAVRSSAINEDGSDAAWAGQLDTYLNTHRGNLLQNIERCWESATSARAKAYAKQKSLDVGPVAVIVQKMIQSDLSGVAFSVHPVTNNRLHMVIEAGLGLGEAIVSGEITPDTYVVHKTSGDVLELHIAEQAKKLVKSLAGENVWELLGLEGKGQKLVDAHIADLAGVIGKLETFFGHPVDVEWALHKGTFYILQSRPITTLAQ
ncbi:MAG TPA: PEP/pyruvate-binding domain-containing protein [Patescibacteria group bacterium]|nr:PEP/pyruvate-binding domain-containing protein [Patescibacteria group bacterium]